MKHSSAPSLFTQFEPQFEPFTGGSATAEPEPAKSPATAIAAPTRPRSVNGLDDRDAGLACLIVLPSPFVSIVARNAGARLSLSPLSVNGRAAGRKAPKGWPLRPPSIRSVRSRQGASCPPPLRSRSLKLK